MLENRRVPTNGSHYQKQEYHYNNVVAIFILCIMILPDNISNIETISGNINSRPD